MEKNRLEAFSDGVVAIIITIMVLELKVPELKERGHHAELADLKPLLPVFLSYVLSFIYVGIYWNNHHHMFQSTRHVTGGILWANLHLLFLLSLFPFATAWVGSNPFEPTPTAAYGVILLCAAIAYVILQHFIIKNQGSHSVLATAVGKDKKGKLSMALYCAAILFAFVQPWISNGIFVLVAAIWFIPDRRIERTLAKRQSFGT
jgi:TMEM175 potassium channel family protein